MDEWQQVDRLTLVDEIHHYGCLWTTLAEPVFLRPGDEVRPTHRGLDVRRDGALIALPGSQSALCGRLR